MAQGVMKMNSEEMEMTMVMMENEKKTTKKNSENTERKKRDDVRIVEWERFLPRMAMRVLLVEADDSTRQIVTALLRKSSYRVTSVSDGLKAWETLKGGPHNIDLILTEVDLPSISGFALLTLIMEHEICKNIPVIMMSSEDSISTVYKCMLRGAADYLVKPLRRNELKTLWQHVWRRQSSTLGANVMEDESVGQQKVETTPQDAASDDSSSNLAGVKRNEDYIEKGSDEQSSCTKPDFGATSAQMEDLQDSSDQLCGKSLPNDVEMQKHGTLISDDRRILMHERETGGSEVATSKVVDARANLAKDVEPESERRDVPRDVPVTSSREAIDFVGTFNNHNFSLNNGENKFDSCPRLDLSLRSQPSGFEDEAAMKKFTLIQSDASAFTRYTNKPLHSTLTSFPNQKKEFGTDSEKILSNIKSNCVNSTPAAKLRTERSINSKATYPLKQSEGEASLHQNKVWPVPVPPESVRLNNVFSGYSSVVPHIFGAQSSLSPVPNSSSANQQEPAIRANAMRQPYLENGTCVYDQLGETAGSCTNRSLQKVDHQKFDSIEDRGRISPTTDQSGSSSFCNGALSRLSSMGYGSASGSNSNVDQAAVGRNEEGFPQSSNRSIQREAALTKFRLKRKDRCYEKKVRYESRKKLAEQRPRVKGQFVRQVQSDSAPASYDNPSSNGADG